jgi:CubicO group peptidase (beta-lactamase class C family)
MVHNSGLPAWRKFYEICDSPKCVLDSIFATPLAYTTGDSTIYSDLGLITTGKIIEKVTGMTLASYVDSVFFKPLGMKNTMYNPPTALWNRVVPTEVDSFWKKTYTAVRGRVHDENAATLGGISGHAGLFSTASDLARILQMELNFGIYNGKRYLDSMTIAAFIQQQDPRSSRGIGWDTRAPGRSFSGQFTSTRTFLHTGFTGTSVVVDPDKKIIVVFLTNRVYPTRNTMKIARVRPAVHEAVYRALVR